MNDIGLKWTKGADVNVATLKDFLIHSSYPLLKFKVLDTGSINYSHDGGETDILVATHDLGYIPLHRLLIQWFDIDSDSKKTSYRNAPFIDTLLSGSIFFRARSYCNATQLRLAVESWTGSGVQAVELKYIYVVYYEPDADL
jgi:hypothetical protein